MKSEIITQQNNCRLRFCETVFLLNFITLSPNSTYCMTVLWIISKLTADISYMYHNSIIRAGKVWLVPNTFINICYGKYFLAVRSKEIQNPIFGICKHDFAAVLVHKALTGVYFNIPAAMNDLTAGCRLCAVYIISPEHSLYTGY